jgi:tetratricopeptide (TPR) repeat protein
LKSVIQIYLNKSEQLFQSNDFLKAIEYLNKLNEIKDYFVEADFLKAKCYEQLNMHDLALEFYHKSAENNHVEAINHKGLILNNDIESKKLFEKALELNKNPKSSKDFKNKGDSLLGLNKHNEALQCYDKAIQSNPNDAVLFNNKGASLSIMGKYQDAISCFNEAIESNPNYAEAFL